MAPYDKIYYKHTVNFSPKRKHDAVALKVGELIKKRKMDLSLSEVVKDSQSRVVFESEPNFGPLQPYQMSVASVCIAGRTCKRRGVQVFYLSMAI